MENIHELKFAIKSVLINNEIEADEKNFRIEKIIDNCEIISFEN